MKRPFQAVEKAGCSVTGFFDSYMILSGHVPDKISLERKTALQAVL